jgi:hypothetical protein
VIPRARRLAVAAAALAAAATVVVPVPPAGAAATHVAIVVRFADGNVSTACASAGGNGYTVLARKYDLNVGTSGPYAGFLLQIDQLPANPKPDTTHYWSYWHASASGSWTYSSSGAGSYTPKAGTIEGWSYVNGESSAPKPAPTGAYTYAALCGASDPQPKPTVTTPAPPTHRASTTAHPTRTPSHHASVPAGHPSTTSPAGPTATASSRSLTTARATPARATSARAPSTSPVAASVSPAQPTASATPTATPPMTSASSPSARSASSGFPAWGTVLALVVVLGLGAAAWFTARRRAG